MRPKGSIRCAGPAFTAKWLAPRLFSFAQSHPEIDLRFAATLKVLDFDLDEVDIAIRFGDTPSEGLFSEVIYQGWISPMMRPDIAAKVKRPEDLLSIPLIHDDSLQFLNRVPNWAEWFRHAGVDAPEMKGLHFSQADHAVDMALEGGGAVLARSSVGAASLRTGALVAPFDLALTIDAQFRLVCPHGAETKPAIAAFRTWLHEEAAKDQPLAEGRRLVHIPNE
ncbi:LysR substrate-binding domain-containing protein [Halovulum sp. GXIMD14793]